MSKGAWSAFENVAKVTVSPMRPARFTLTVLGISVVLAGMLVVIAGTVGLWAFATQQGFVSMPPHRYATTTYALTSAPIEFAASPTGRGLGSAGRLSALRIGARRADDGAVFVGIGARDDVGRYLRNSAHDEPDAVRLVPYTVEYDRLPGEVRPSAPAREPIWAASAVGKGMQQVSWPVRTGEWTVVVMNADAGSGVTVDVAAGATTRNLLPVAVAVVALGVLLGSVGAVLLVLAGRIGRD